MTTYAVALSDIKTGSQAYLAKTEAERFEESWIAFRAETLGEVAKWLLSGAVRGAKRYTEAGEWRPVSRRFVRVKLIRIENAGTPREFYTEYPDMITMGDLPEWVLKHA